MVNKHLEQIFHCANCLWFTVYWINHFSLLEQKTSAQLKRSSEEAFSILSHQYPCIDTNTIQTVTR